MIDALRYKMDVLPDFVFDVYSEYVAPWYFIWIIVTGYLLYYILEVVKPPTLLCGPGKYRDFLEANMPVLNEKFWPTVWCFEPRLCTVLAHYTREWIIPKQPYRREILNLSDGGEIGLDWREGCFDANAPVLVALPGITGNSTAEYIRNIAMTAHNLGIRCVVFNYRGMGGVALKTGRAYCACSYEDLSEVIRHVRNLYPRSPIALLGVSMGGLLVGNYLAAKAEEARSLVAAALLVSPPWDVNVGCESVEMPYLNRMLNHNLASNLVATYERNYKLFEGQVDREAVLSSKTIREFDSMFTSKTFGFRDVNHYYEHATISTKIHKFAVPTLCLSSADDPFQPIRGIPINEAKETKHVAIVLTSHGGHIGFMEGLFPFGTNQFMQRVVGQYLAAMLLGDNYSMFKLA